MACRILPPDKETAVRSIIWIVKEIIVFIEVDNFRPAATGFIFVTDRGGIFGFTESAIIKNVVIHRPIHAIGCETDLHSRPIV